LGVGFVLEVVAQLLVVVAGGLVALRLARSPDARPPQAWRGDWVGWSLMGLGLAGAVLLVLTGLRVSEIATALGVSAVWAAALAIAVSLLAVSLRPRVLGGVVLVAWLVCAVALFSGYHVMLDYFGDYLLIDLFLASVIAVEVLVPFWVRGDRASADAASG
jgi:hypothetical protein